MVTVVVVVAVVVVVSVVVVVLVVVVAVMVVAVVVVRVVVVVVVVECVIRRTGREPGTTNMSSEVIGLARVGQFSRFGWDIEFMCSFYPTA